MSSPEGQVRQVRRQRVDGASSIRRAAVIWGLWCLACWALVALPAAHAVELRSVQYAAQPGNRVDIQLDLSAPIAPPETFATDSPARIALDLPGVTSRLENKTVPIGIGAVHSLVAVEAGDRTRVVLNLSNAVPYEVHTEGARITVRLNPSGQPPAAVAAPAGAETGPTVIDTTARPAQPYRPPAASGSTAAAPQGPAVRDIDFRRGPGGEGRVLIRLPSADTRVAVRDQAGRVFVDVYDSALPQRLFRRLDVVDFATPVTQIESKPKGRHVEVETQLSGDYDYMAYQTDDLFTLEFRRLTPDEREQMARQRVVYEGDRLSLNFQDIEVRAVLQVLADFTDLNLVASDTVGGSITLRLKNVPWDQALDIILKTKGLSMRQTGNVIMVAPTQEMAAQEKLELESVQQIAELAPLRSEFIQVNYAKASELAALLRSADNNMLSERGAVTVDTRTNTLLVQDTSSKLEDVRSIVTRLDVPVRQVMIESRVVIANNEFARDLGVRFGVSGSMGTLGGHEMMVAGGRPGHIAIGNFDKGPFGLNVETGTPYNSGLINPAGSGLESLLVNLPTISEPSGAVNFLIGKVGSYLLQLELSAMQREGRGEIVSSPRVITSDQHQASIKFGEEIPYQESASSGNTTVAFKEAVLQLDVTPHITPDDRIIMDLKVTKDQANWSRSVDGQPPIDTRSVETRVLVDNGETVVLGGVYERTKTFSRQQVPFLGDVPILGRLFKQEAGRDQNSELLIFVTPKILKTDVAQR